MNCWQTGTLGAESQSCDTVGPGFLEVPGRLANISGGGIGADVQFSPSGDYCSYYNLNAALNKQDPNVESGATGLEVVAPLGSYQEWDGAGNVCQARLNQFGQEFRKASCAAKTCGMHHYVSLHDQGYGDRPWSKLFGSPKLTVSAEANVQVLSGVGAPAGWGYVCPIFQDAAPPHNILEYCLQEWRGPGNAKPEWEAERIGTFANGPSSNNIDTVQTFFYTGTSLATNNGPATTGVASAGWKSYSASITEANLENAIAFDRRPYKLKAGSGSGESTPELGYGCARQLSSDPAEYALIGIEQGTEGWSFGEIGASANNFYVRTDYTPLAPTAVTEGATLEGDNLSRLQGSVNAEGQLTSYHFDYGLTASYGQSTASGYVGSATRPVSVVENISTTSATVYRYRVVATSAGGTTYGEDRTFTSGGPTVETVAASEVGEPGVAQRQSEPTRSRTRSDGSL